MKGKQQLTYRIRHYVTKTLDADSKAGRMEGNENARKYPRTPKFLLAAENYRALDLDNYRNN